MSYLNQSSAMPRETRHLQPSRTLAPYPREAPAERKVPSTWTAEEDAILLKARADGLNWDPIHAKYFSNKTPNACRKRHERIMQNRQVDEWGSQKIELLASEYLNCRKEMWMILAKRLGLKESQWQMVEEKCMEKGLKPLQAAARRARRGGSINSQAFEDTGNSDHASDSGIGLGSDTEREVGIDTANYYTQSSPQQHAHDMPQSASRSVSDHGRSHSMSSVSRLPIYEPPPLVSLPPRNYEAARSTTLHPYVGYSAPTTYRRLSPDSQNGRGGFSIQAVLSD